MPVNIVTIIQICIYYILIPVTTIQNIWNLVCSVFIRHFPILNVMHNENSAEQMPHVLI